jgi:hypothetical protein
MEAKASDIALAARRYRMFNSLCLSIEPFGINAAIEAPSRRAVPTDATGRLNWRDEASYYPEFNQLVRLRAKSGNGG